MLDITQTLQIINITPFALPALAIRGSFSKTSGHLKL